MSIKLLVILFIKNDVIYNFLFVNTSEHPTKKTHLLIGGLYKEFTPDIENATETGFEVENFCQDYTVK